MRTIDEIKQRLSEIQADPRMSQPSANIFSNAPLAIIQADLEAWEDALLWVLAEPGPEAVTVLMAHGGE